MKRETWKTAAFDDLEKGNLHRTDYMSWVRERETDIKETQKSRKKKPCFTEEKLEIRGDIDFRYLGRGHEPDP